MNIRNIRQQEFANIWLNSERFGILNLCTRFGKIRTSIIALEKLKHNRILICVPDLKIKNSWIADFEEFEFNRSCVTFTTYLSLKKFIDVKFDIVILDELHLMSQNQINVCKELFEINKVVLGLSGTISRETEITLLKELNLPIIAEYSME